MILGLSISAFVALHVGISLIGIVTGLVALPLLALGRKARTLHIAFLATTLATTLTGFLFPFGGITPALVVGAVSTLVLAVAIGAFLRRAGRTYAISATIGLYLNLFVLVVQSFLKVPALNALAPAGTEPAFLVAQSLTLAASVALGVWAFRGTRPTIAAII